MATQPSTIEDTVVLLQRQANLPTLEQAAGITGEIIWKQFPRQEFRHPLPNLSPTKRQIEIDGRSVGPWLKAVSRGECDWDDLYEFNFRTLLNDQQLPGSQSLPNSFLMEVDSLPQPLMRDFQAHPGILTTIVTKARNSIGGKSRTKRTEAEQLRYIGDSIHKCCAPDTSRNTVLNWLDTYEPYSISGISDIDVIVVNGRPRVTFHLSSGATIRRAFKTILDNFVRRKR